MTETITNNLLFRAILTGADRTRERREDLNRINVFPVVDHDTGNNLAHTMNYILSHAEERGSIKETLKDIAKAALVGARGNSGAIFSQYFYGLSQVNADSDTMTLSELAAGFQEAYNKAYKAIESPVEGTVITLMRAWSVSFKESLQERKSVAELFETALSQIKQALDNTTNTLKALKSLGIVDAGALGFYYFMDGFVQGILKQHTQINRNNGIDILPDVEDGIHTFSDETEIVFRYCTEVLFEFKSLDLDKYKQQLRPLGDCLLISAADTMARVHLHTNQPWEVVKITAAHGAVLEQKADDMVWQNLLAGPPEGKIACVTDSIADLPQEFVFEHNVFQIPINIMAAGVSYLDKITMDGVYLSQHMDTASSAQLNKAQINTFLKPILRHFKHVLILTVSSQMSGTYSRFKEALADLNGDENEIVLIDTKVNSGAQGLLVREAVGMIEGGMPLQQIAAAIEAMKSRAKIVVSVLDIEPMARSGRVSEKIGSLLIKLNFKPLVTINREGKGTIKGIAFTAKRNRKIFLKALRNKKMECYAIVHADAHERAESVRQELVRITGKEPLYITQISSVVTLFAGQGCVAVAYLDQEPETAE